MYDISSKEKEERIEYVLKAVGMLKYKKKNVSELSGGQQQRIAIARALYADTPILILDEATSALDSETESRLLNHLKQLTDKTVLIVTHRTEAMKLCNRRFHFETEGILTEHREVAEIE